MCTYAVNTLESCTVLGGINKFILRKKAVIRRSVVSDSV